MAKSSATRTRTADTRVLFAQLSEIAGNLWWSWHPEAVAIFEHANARVFRSSDHNPVVVLAKLSEARKRALAGDDAFAQEVRDVRAALREYLRAPTWHARTHVKEGAGGRGGKAKGVLAYFCMEYAIHESLPIYAGGLGVLAGDHLKSASDLGLPFVAIGVYWKKGYTRQRINAAGRQQDEFRTLRPEDTPLVEVTARGGRPLRVEVPMGRDTVVARAWRLDVGRAPLYLLDADLPENKPADRKLTHALYSGDRDTRIRQEILLGIGGWRLLEALKIPVLACHLNEGHAAFCSLERIARRIARDGETFAKASRHVRDTTVFTTHTPVPAGNEEFEPALVDRYFMDHLETMGLTRARFHDLGRVRAGDESARFGMTPLALRTARYANGVAALHGRIARHMWKDLYPGKKLADVPIGHVTNGIHIETWLHPRMAELYDLFLGDNWRECQDVASTWEACRHIPDDALWSLRQELKRELIEFCRRRAQGASRRGKTASTAATRARHVLDPDALTIGFARRFAPYKRAALVFHDPARLARILDDRDRPVQIIFAGKAHPADEPGKAIIERLIQFAREPRFRHRVVFLEDYEMDVARHMVAGVDVWLNTPERPREASGTSGMKPPLHGGLNLSILDGWWPEGHRGHNGWAIGKGKDHDGTPAADARDATALYKLLEEQVAPMYYAREGNGLPVKWLRWMKSAMMTIPPVFNTHRQVKEYWKRYYLPAMRKG
jgi:starch phosphorylase